MTITKNQISPLNYKKMQSKVQKVSPTESLITKVQLKEREMYKANNETSWVEYRVLVYQSKMRLYTCVPKSDLSEQNATMHL